jgi:hypothetical protein
MIKVFLLAIVVMALAMVGFAITMLLKKGGKFPNTHISGNKYLKKHGVYCSQTQDRLEQQKAWKKVNFEDVMFVSDNKAGE